MIDRLAYLDAKRRVDDRAIDGAVLAAAFGSLPPRPQVLEVGAGTLTMVERLHDWGAIRSGDWLAVDRDGAALERGIDRLRDRADVTTDGRGVAIGDLAVRPTEADATTVVERTSADILVGCAFFDLVDPADLPTYATSADRIYAPITYDGQTRFDPPHDADRRVVTAYHTHMARYRPGTPRGAEALRRTLTDVEASAPSPWRIDPPYHPEEATVLGYVLRTVEAAAVEVGVDPRDWVIARRDQLADGELRYRAHNVDLLGSR